jgi:ABC-type bacteriocin/lantibiotic exporter with double-glycine peptidase domain
MRALISILFLSGTSILANVSSLENVDLSQCGINSLYLCLKHHKIDVSIEEIYSSIKPDAQNNVSLYQLANYARSKGLHVKAIIKPSISDIQKSLNNNVILQYRKELPNNSELTHIVALIRHNSKTYLLDYPSQRREVTAADFTKVNIKSDGLLILSENRIIGWQELLNLRSLKSVSFYSIVCGLFTTMVVFITSKCKNYSKKGKI